MPAIVINRTSTAAETVSNAIDGLKFDTIPEGFGALITLYSTTSNEGDTVGLSVGNEDYLVDAEPNTEAASGVADTDRDALLVREPVNAGKIYLRLSHAAISTIKVILNIEYVPV